VALRNEFCSAASENRSAVEPQCWIDLTSRSRSSIVAPYELSVAEQLPVPFDACGTPWGGGMG